MPALRSRNLFISHSWSYSDAYDKFVALLDDAPNFRYRNYSVPKDNPVHNARNAVELFEAIKQQVIFCEVVVILAGVYATHSKWIDKEIKIATDVYRKPILAVEPWGAERTSEVVKKAADRTVKWSTSSIVTAIRELSP